MVLTKDNIREESFRSHRDAHVPEEECQGKAHQCMGRVLKHAKFVLKTIKKDKDKDNFVFS